MITYNDIYEAARKERYSEQLQNLPKNFINDVATYLKEKREIASKEDDMFSEVIMKTKKQLENAITLFREFMLRRRKKILNLVLIATETGISKRDFDNMLNFEKTVFENLIRCIDSSEKEINELMNGEKEKKKDELIVFKKNVKEFIGLDGEKMGPYEEGQIINLPKEIAKILIEDKKVDVVEGK